MSIHAEAASLGITPYTGNGLRLIEAGPDSSYYSTDRYKDFDRALVESARAHDVTVIDNQRSTGIYQHKGEPSTALRVHGVRHAIESIAREVGQAYEQYAVRIIYAPGTGEHTVYTYPIRDHEPENILAALAAAGASGGRIINGNLEIADSIDLSQHAQDTLTRRLGKPNVHACEVVRIITGTDQR